MIADFRVKAGFPMHPKTRKLQRRLGPAGPWAFMCLWAFMTREGKTDGRLHGMSDEDIEIAADWDGEEGALVDALVEVRFMDGGELEREIHDWEEHQPWLAGAKDRSEQARKAALTRHAKGKKKDARSKQAASGEHAGSMRAADGEDKDRNAPYPSPFPSSSVPNGTEAAPRDPKERFWGWGKEVLTARGVPKRDAGSLLGKLLKLHDEDPTVPLEVLETIERDNVVDPVSWLGAMFKPENTARLPRRDEDLPGWAAKHGFPDARPGEDWRAYRTRLTRLIEEKRRAA